MGFHTARRSSVMRPVSDTPMVWHGWGDPLRRSGLPPTAETFLAASIGGMGMPHQPVALADVRLGESALSPERTAALVAAVGAEHVRTDRVTRVAHAGGKSYPDLVRRRAGDAVAAPDAVVLPADHDQVQAVLSCCATAKVAVVPFGGGTSVVGGVEPERGGFDALIAVDLSRMAALVEVDAESLTATFQPGIRGPHAEALLRAEGFTLGHFPQSYEYATLGGYLATRSAGQASTGYGRFDEVAIGARCATPAGELRVGSATSTAAGPDLLELVAGSEGTLGIITELTVRIHRAPEIEDHRAWAVSSFEDGASLLRDLIQSGVAPDIARLSDEYETRTSLAQAPAPQSAALRRYLSARGMRHPCLLVLGWEGTQTSVRRGRRLALHVLRRHRTVALGRVVGAAWANSRFSAPYLRDDLLDRGVMVETLETATRWSQIDQLYRAVRDALAQSLASRGTPALVLCHISHLYLTGASLYFTWVARQEPGAELEQWRAAKTAASDAIVRNGGTITHHHAVGLDHRPWMRDEIGDLGIEVLRAVKGVLDPAGVLNPGKLIPPVEAEATTAG